MRWSLGVITFLIVFIISGCAYKHQALHLSPFLPKDYSVSKGPSLEKVYIKSVIDKRKEPNILGTIYDKNGYAITYASAGEDITLWVYNALQKGLEAKGIVIVNNPEKDAKTIRVNLEELNARYDEGLLKEDNLQASMLLEIEIKRNDTIITKRISQASKKWHKPIKDSASFKPIIEDLMQDVLERTVGEIASF